MYKSMFPEIHFVIHCASSVHKGFRIRKAIRVPHKRAGVGVRLPSCFEADHVAWDLFLAELLRQCKSARLRSARFGPVPKAQPPLRRHKPATGEDVIAADGIEYLRAG